MAMSDDLSFPRRRESSTKTLLRLKYCFGLDSRLRGNDKYRVHRLGELPIGSVGTPQIS